MTLTTVKSTLDMRVLAPRERHPLILKTFNELAPGEAFMLVNDRDPNPLYYEFQAGIGPTFAWDYVESGPEIWRVTIARKAS